MKPSIHIVGAGPAGLAAAIAAAAGGPAAQQPAGPHATC